MLQGDTEADIHAVNELPGISQFLVTAKILDIAEFKSVKTY